MKIFQKGGSRGTYGVKFVLFSKNQETKFLLKKKLFLRRVNHGVPGGPPDEGKKKFHTSIGREMRKTLTLINLASKSRFY